ncbi:MAG TPA: Mur ligase domain-containing protein, partial [Opitutus sp.]|nr:Mur ligase domain-containing protein [Opitutus sp.]
MSGATLPMIFGREVQRIHCLGAGGMGVAPLAIYLSQLGFNVTGEDDGLTEEVRGVLERERVRIVGMPKDCELVVYSSAIGKAHPVYAAAAARGIPLSRRGEMLAEIVREKKLVAVCGSHGKTTTTALLITALRHANFSAGYLLGGLFADESSPARAGSNEWVVAEIDESDGTIERFSPEITVCVNLDWDHPDQYRQFADLERTFAELFARTRGTVLVSDAGALSGRLGVRQGQETPPDMVTFGRTGDFRGEIEQEGALGMT